MTNFLGRLAQRSLAKGDRHGPGEALAPRLPSLFEPPGGDVTSPEADSGMGRAMESGPVESRLSMDTNVGSPTILPQMQTSLRPSLPQPPRPEHPFTATSLSASGRDESILASPREGRAVIQTLMGDGGLPQDSPMAGPPPVASLPLPRILPALPPVSQPSPSGRQERRSENVAGEKDDGNETTVHINIGRIEVRAVHSPQPKAPDRKTVLPARLTIEEYARQRNEGKR